MNSQGVIFFKDIFQTKGNFERDMDLSNYPNGFYIIRIIKGPMVINSKITIR